MNSKILYSIMIVCFISTGFVKQTMIKPIRKVSPTIGLSTKLTSPVQLKSILLKYTNKQIVFFKSFSIGENENAAFAIAEGDVWYISKSLTLKLTENITYSADNQYQRPYLWTVGDTTIFKCEDAPGGSSSISHAWYVKHGKPIELPFVGMNLFYIGKGKFTTMGESFDLNITDGLSTGHTYKHYYLYWTKNGMKEYGGLQVTKQQIIKIKGVQAVIDTITKSGHTIDEIYYRANNIININYHSGDKQNGNFDNVTLLYKNNTAIPVLAYANPNSSKTENLDENNLSDFSYGGIYRSALFSQIATYPNKFPIK